MTAPEYRETCLFHQWLEGQRIPHTHIVNEQPNRKRAIAEKQMGKSKGFPDMLVFLPNGVNVAIEMKRCDKPAYATPEQKRWLAFLASRGFKCAICHGCEEAVQFVRECSCENKSAWLLSKYEPSDCVTFWVHVSPSNQEAHDWRKRAFFVGTHYKTVTNCDYLNNALKPLVLRFIR